MPLLLRKRVVIRFEGIIWKYRDDEREGYKSYFEGY